MTDSTASSLIAAAKANLNIQSVSFPADIGNFYMSLNFYDYRTAFGSTTSPVSQGSNTTPLQNIYNDNGQSIANQIAKKGSFATIQLPIPSTLVDTFRVNYESTELGGLAGAVTDLMGIGQDVGKAISSLDPNNLNKLKTDASEMGIAAGKVIAKQLTDSGATFGVNASGLYDLASGTAVNPNLAVLFRGPTLKSHNFSWSITPRSSQESQNIKKIIAIIKRAMHPSRTFGSNLSALLTYPSECLIQFIGTTPSGSVFLYPLRPVVIESLSTNYAPGGMPSFYQTSSEPVTLEMSISCQETSYNTRDSFDDTSQTAYDGFSTSSLTNGSVDGFGNQASAASSANSVPIPSQSTGGF